MILPFIIRHIHALVSKSCTTLSASSFEDISSVSGSHSLSEAMYLASLSLLRLICPQHLFYTSCKLFESACAGTCPAHGKYAI